MHSFIKTRLLPFVVLLFTLLFCARSSANALDWLDGQANSDGSYTAVADPATPFQATAETLRAFASVAATSRTGIPAAREFLAADPTRNTEYLARRITAQPADSNTPPLIAELRARQNPLPPFGDGGFGDTTTAPSTVLDTALALEALAVSGQTAAPELAFALGFLLERQSSEGGWSDGVNLSSVYLTAQIAHAMQPYRNRYALEEALDSAVQFLLSRRAANNLIGTTSETALALLAIAPKVFDVTAYQGTLDALRAAQAADGSWDASVYTTALAVRALAAVTKATPSNPTLGTVNGVITDAVDGSPLSGASVALGGADSRTTTTTTDGSYLIENVTPGAISLRVEQPGYLTVTATDTTATGGRVDFSAALPRDPQPQPLTLTGRVINAIDNTTLPGVTLRVINSGTTTQSGSDGSFTLAGLAAGSYLVEVSTANFVTTQLSIAAAAGGSLDLGTIALNNTAGTDSGITGTVIDALTRAPLRGVAITFSDPDAGAGYSNVDGRFELRPVTPGALTINAALAGYRTASVTATLAAGTDLGIHITLVQTGNPAEVSVQGRLVDATTTAPLAGATVRVVAGLAQQTGPDGSFLLGGIPAGAFTLQFSQTGYQPVSYSVSAPAGGSVQLGTIQLAPEGPVTDNRPPAIASAAPILASTGKPYVYNVLASDADGDPLSFGLLAQPAGMRIDVSTGQIRWIPTVGQTGTASFSVVVADDQGGVATQDVTVQVGAGSGRSYVITDIQTLNGLVINDTVPQNYVPGSYVSGAVPGTTFSSPPCPLTWSLAGNDVPGAIAAPDRLAIQPGPGIDIIMDLGQVYDTVSVFPQVDHLPFPQEGIEYTVWGANDPAAPFPDGWALGTLVSIYAQGFEVNASCNGADETDDYAGLYSFGQQAFRYLRVRTDYSITLFDTPAHVTWQQLGDDGGEPGWQSREGEIDAVGGMLCSVKPVADAGSDILGVTGDNIVFDASASNGANLRFGWDIDGDRAIDLNGPNPGNVFTAGFDGDVILYAIDERGCVGTDQVRVTIGLDIPKPDLVIDTFVTDDMQTDPFTLQASGSANITVRNQGRAPALTAAQLSLFEDRNGNGRFDIDSDNLLGAITLPNGLARDAQVTINIPVSGQITFRDSPLLVMVDSDQRIKEQREDNNVADSASICSIDPVQIGAFQPTLKWQWGQEKVMTIPLVAPLSDSNGDGRIDQQDDAAVIFASHSGFVDNSRARLRAVDGRSGAEIWSVTDTARQTEGSAHPALGDIDGDGLPEIVMYLHAGGVIAINNDGSTKWTSNLPVDSDIFNYGSISLADLDADGQTEILARNTVLNSDGTLRWSVPDVWHAITMVAADLDMDGVQEVLVGARAYTASGADYWDNSNKNIGFTAISNLDQDDFPEFVVVISGRVTAYDQDGSVLWQSPVPGGGGGAPVVADLDGDGLAEIGVAGRSNYVTYNHDGSLLWQKPTRDFSSRITGSTVFDFDGDGSAEVVYGDETTLRVYDGATGEVVYAIPNRSATASEYPVVADVDGDNHAELLVVADSGPIGLRVFEDAQDSWMPTRGIWNQYAYHISNINDDTSIPVRENPSWLSHNSYRLNAFPDRDPLLSPDLTLSRLRVNADTAGQPATLTARIGNGGASTTPAPSSVSFYAGDPASGILLGSVPVPVLAAGAFVDITLSNPPALTGSSDIVAVVDVDNALTECREGNNRQSVPLLLQTRDAGITVASDAAVYPPAAAVQLSADISNNSVLPGEFKVQLHIEDLGGTLITSFPLRDTGPLDGRASQTQQESWDSSGFLSGSYRVRAELFSVTGDKLAEASATFILRHPADQGPAVTLSLQPDRAVYFTRDSARITQRVTNLSQSTLIEAAQLSLSVADMTGQIIFTSSDPLNALVPGTLRDRIANHSFDQLDPGVYSINGELRTADGTLLATAQGSYRVEAGTTLALRGTVQVRSGTLERGQTQLCTDTLSNLASTPLDTQAIRQLLIKLDNAEVLSSSETTLTLEPGASDSLVRSIATGNLAEGIYSCVLQARITDVWTTLANAPFTVIEPPIDIAATLEQSSALRLLILVDAPEACDSDNDSDDDSHDEDCPATSDSDPRGPSNAPSLSAQRNFLEDSLTAQGWSYRIVTDADTFTRELRRGGYTTYALFSEQVKLKEQVQKELREAVFRGEGLLVMLNEDNRYEALGMALGIRLRDKLSAPAALNVEAVENITAGNADFTLVEAVGRITLRGAEAVARYPGLSPCNDDDEHDNKAHQKDDDSDDNSHDATDCSASAIALTHHRYGDGHSLGAGFDLLAQAAHPAAGALFPNLLSEALVATRPAPPVALLTGSVTAIRLMLTNQGITTPGQAVITPQADSQTLDPGLATVQPDARLLWPFTLQENTDIALTFWLQLPAAVGPAGTDALLQVGISPDLADYDSLQLSLDLNPRPGLVDVLDTLTTLVTQDNAYRKTLKHVQKAKHYLDQGKAEKALKAALKAADTLISLDRPQAATVRRQLALAITVIERQL